MDDRFRHIPEHEYSENLDRSLRDLAREIAFSGLSLAEIARGTRMKWDTVYAASQCRPVRMDNAERIRYFIRENRKYAQGTKDHTPVADAAERGSD